jgi:hypothetical protein
MQRTLVDVGKDTTLGDGDVPKELVQLLIVADGELEVTGDDTRLLVVTRRVTSQLENLGREVLKDGGEVDGSAGTDTLSVVALAEKTVDTADGEGQTSLGRTAVDGKRSQKMALQNKGLDPKNITRRMGWWKDTHDCAFLEPLALPPDLPPVIFAKGVG